MEAKHPFALRDHGNKIIEISVTDSQINGTHKAIATLALLGQKFSHTILNLQEGSSLSPSVKGTLEKIGEFGQLKIVSDNEKQIPFELNGIKIFSDILAAKHRIKGENCREKVLKQMESISPLRSSAYSLLQLLRNPEVTFEEIEEMASQDPNLVVRILKTANTAYFMRRIPIETLKNAVAYLGLEGIREILMHVIFNGFSAVFPNQSSLLAHLRRSAHLSSYLAQIVGLDKPSVGKARVCGLLHDIGSLALSFYSFQDYAKVLMKIRNDKVLPEDAELDVFGVTHLEIGKYFAMEIGLPEYIQNAIEKHHDTDNLFVENDIYAIIVACCNGFLNENIEQVPFSTYDHLLHLLAEEMNKDAGWRKRLVRLKLMSESSALASEKAEEDAENAKFHASQFIPFLKEELDRFLMDNSDL